MVIISNMNQLSIAWASVLWFNLLSSDPEVGGGACRGREAGRGVELGVRALLLSHPVPSRLCRTSSSSPTPRRPRGACWALLSVGSSPPMLSEASTQTSWAC